MIDIDPTQTPPEKAFDFITGMEQPGDPDGPALGEPGHEKLVKYTPPGFDPDPPGIGMGIVHRPAAVEGA